MYVVTCCQLADPGIMNETKYSVKGWSVNGRPWFQYIMNYNQRIDVCK